MKRLWKRKWFWVTSSAVVGGLTVLGFCWVHRVWSVNEWLVYRAMDRECHPAWQDFHYGKVQPGDPVEDVIARTDPVRVERMGRMVVLKYQSSGLCFTGITAVAYDGHMVGAYAWSCRWTRQFFDTMSDEQRTEFSGDHYDQPARMGNAVLVR